MKLLRTGKMPKKEEKKRGVLQGIGHHDDEGKKDTAKPGGKKKKGAIGWPPIENKSEKSENGHFGRDLRMLT